MPTEWKTKNLKVKDKLMVDGNLSVSGSSTHEGTLSIGGQTHISNALSVTNDLSVGGMAYLQGTTVNTVIQQTETTNKLDVEGSVSVGGTAVFNSDLSVGGSITSGEISTATIHTGSIDLGTSGTFNAGTATLKSVTIDDSLTVNSGVSITGDTISQVTAQIVAPAGQNTDVLSIKKDTLNLLSIDKDGLTNIPNASLGVASITNNLTVNGGNTSAVTLNIKGTESQTANVVEVRDFSQGSSDFLLKVSPITANGGGVTTISSLVTNQADINGGSIDGTTIGLNNAVNANFAVVGVSGALTVDNSLSAKSMQVSPTANGTVFQVKNASDTSLFKIDASADGGQTEIANLYSLQAIIKAGSIDDTSIGSVTANSGAFTTLSASGSFTANSDSSFKSDVVIQGINENASLVLKRASNNPSDSSSLFEVRNINSEGNESTVISMDKTGNLSAKSLSLDGTTVNASAAELNTLVGVTATASEINQIPGIISSTGNVTLLDGASAGTIVNSKAVVYGSNGELNAGILQISGGSVTSTANELNLLDGSQSGSIVNSKAVIYGSSGEVNMSNLKLGGVQVTSSAAELNKLTGLNSTSHELNYLFNSGPKTIANSRAVIYGDNGEINASVLQIAGSSITSNVTELNLLDGSSAGTVANSKAVVYGSSGEVNSSKLQVNGTDLQIYDSQGNAYVDTASTLNLGKAGSRVVILGDLSVAGSHNISGGSGGSSTTLDGLNASIAELNILAGTTATSADLAKLAGITATASNLNILAGTSVTSSDLDRLAAITSSSAELNLLDGVTVTTQEINLLRNAGPNTITNSKAVIYGGSGEVSATTVNTTTVNTTNLNLNGTQVNATAAELNILNGATITTNQINQIPDIITSTGNVTLLEGSSPKTVVNNKAVIYGGNGEINATTLQIGNTSITSTANELNLLDGSSAGTVVNSKALVYGSSGEVNSSKLQVNGTDLQIYNSEGNAYVDTASTLNLGKSGSRVVILGDLSVAGSHNISGGGSSSTLDGLTASVSELNILDGTSVTSSDLAKLAGITAGTAEINVLTGSSLTTQDLNKLGGITATKDEINILDGLTATTNNLNVLAGSSVTSSDLNKLNSITASAANINILNGTTATGSDLAKLAGITAGTAEINVLTGSTLTTQDLNKLAGVTASKEELNILDGVTATATNINVLAGTSATSSDLAKLAGITAGTAEINVLTGSSLTTQDLNKLGGITATKDEINVLDGILSTTSELNLLRNSLPNSIQNSKAVIYGGDGEVKAKTLDTENIKLGGVALSTTITELNKLSGLTATSSQLNTLSGLTASASEINLLDGALANTVVNNKAVVYGSAGEVNATTFKIGGVAITATAADINRIAGLNTTASELNVLSGLTSTSTELNVLDGITASTSELNLLTGTSPNAIVNNKAVIYGSAGQINVNSLQIGGTAVTATATELNKLAGVTASASEINILDGVTANATQINKLDGVTVSTEEINLLDGSSSGSVVSGKAVVYGSSGEVNASKLQISGSTINATANEINILSGVTSTASEINILDGVTANSTQINYLDIAVLGVSQNSKVVTQGSDGVITVGSVNGNQVLNIASHDLSDGGLKLAGTLVKSSADELNYLSQVSVGQTKENKAVVLDGNGDLTIMDNDKFRFGTGNDMQLYHDGTNSHITNSGGNLNINTSSGVLNLGTSESGIAVSIGNTTSEVTVNDNLTVSGNLTVVGSVSTTHATTHTVEDKLIKLGNGSVVVDEDLGIVFTRGNGTSTNKQNVALLWDSSESTFAFASTPTEDGETSGNVVIDGYSSLRVDSITSNSNSTFSSGITVTGNSTFSDGAYDFDIASHDGTNGLKLGGVLVSASAAELNKLSGVTSSASEINILDGVTANTSELNILDGVTATTAEINVLDGDTSATSTTVAGGDRVVFNDEGTMKQVAMTDLDTYFSASSSTLTNKTLTTPTINGASLSGTISGTPTFSGVVTHSAKDVYNTGLSVKNGNTSAGFIEFFENADNGNRKTTLKGSETVTNITVTLPSVSDTLVGLSSTDTLTNKTLTSAVLNTPTITGNTTFSDGAYDLDIASHDGNNGLKLGGVLVTASAAEINILDGVTATTSEINILDGVTATKDEINILDGVTSNASELNLLDGAISNNIVNSKAVIYGSAGQINATTLQIGGESITATAAEINRIAGLNTTASELNILSGLSATASELNTLDGISSSTSELNLLDGSSPGTIVNNRAVIYGTSGQLNARTLQIDGTPVTATAAELSILNGVTASTSEINILDGVTASTSEINTLQGVTSTASELNLVDGSVAGVIVNNKALVYGSAGQVNATTLQISGTSITSSASEINILDGATLNTNELNILDGVTANSAELNYLDISLLGTSENSKVVTQNASGVINIGTASGNQVLNIASHDLVDGGLKLAGTLVTASATEINILDGLTASTSELNTLDGLTASTAELNIMDGVTATSSELNILDGDTTATSTTVAETDRVVYNDNGTMKQVSISDLDTYFSSSTSTLTNKTLTSPTINGLSLSGTITGTPTFNGVLTHSAQDIYNSGLSIKNGNTSSGFIDFYEDSDNGTNKARLIGPSSTDEVTITLPSATDTLVGKATTDTLTNKTLTNPTINAAVLNGSITGTSTFSDVVTFSSQSVYNAGVSVKNGNDSAGFIDFFEKSGNGTNKATLIGPVSTSDVTITLPASTDTLVGRATTDTLTNKTLTSAVMNTPTITGNTTFSDGAYDFDIASHDGTNGLKLGGTLVTSSATELNILDGVTASTSQLNYLNIDTLGTSQAGKAVTVDSNGDLIIPDSDKFNFGSGSDMQLYHDGTNSYINNTTGTLNINSTAGTLNLGTSTSGVAVSIGHSTSEVTINDNLTVSGNLSVAGTVTTTHSTSFTVQDKIIKLGNGNTGVGQDLGIVFTRGDGSDTNKANVSLLWDESADVFSFVNTNEEDGTTNGNVTINDYASVRLGALTADDASTFSQGVTITGNSTFSDGAYDFDIASHDGTNGLKLGGTLVTASAAQLNVLNGVTASTSEINILDGVTSTAAEINILDGVTSTTSELNVMDGDTSATSTTVASADRVVFNDDGTMKQVAMTDLDTYFSASSSTLTNKTLTTPTVNGASLSGTLSGTPTFSGAVIHNGLEVYNAGLSVKNGNTSAGFVEFFENSDNGSNKTTLIGAGAVSNITVTLPSSSDTLVGLATSDTLTNKTLTSAVLNTPTITGNTTFSDGAYDLNIASHDGNNGLKLGGVLVTASAAELNILDGVTSTAAELNILDGVTATKDEINILDGVTASSTELNLLDGSSSNTVVNNKAVIYGSAGQINANKLQIDGVSINASAVEINKLVGLNTTTAELNRLTGLTATASEMNILSGITSTASELNLLDGSSAATVVNNRAVIYGNSGQINTTSLQIGGVAVTSTAAELNILDGVTSTASELNILDGVTASTSELNILDGVTSTAAELNLVDGSSAGTVVSGKAVVYGSSGEVNATTLQIAGTSITSTAAELNILDGVTSTAAELNILDGVTATSTELNYLDIETLGTSQNSKVVTQSSSGVVTIGATDGNQIIDIASHDLLDGGLKLAGTLVTSSASEINLLDGSSAGTIVNSKAVVYGSSGEVNATTLQIGGTSITSTATELNILDGVTANTSEINLLDGVTATTAELNYLDITALGVSENSKVVTQNSSGVVTIGATDGNQVLNIASHDLVDGGLKLGGTLVTASASEINILDGVTSSTTEINLLDGVTATTAEINYLDVTALGVSENSKVVTQNSSGVVTIGATDGNQVLNIASHDLEDGGLKLAGTLVTASASEINILDGVTATATELNYVDITTLGQSEASKAVTADANGDITITGASANMVWDKSENALEFADNASIQLGTGLDLKLHHNGTNSFINNTTGTLNIDSTSGALNLGTSTSGVAVSIGHSTSEVTVNDNLTVTGDLTVGGSVTTTHATSYTVQDKVIKLGNGNTGVGQDLGIVFTRGDGSDTNKANVSLIWDESADVFSFVNTNEEDGTTNGNITINDYAGLRVGALTADDASTFSQGVTITGNSTFSDGAYDFDIASHDGTNGLKLGGTLVTATAAQLNILSGVTATASELNILSGVTSTAAELNILDGVTATTAELNYLDLTTLGTSEASKVVTADANGDVILAGAAANLTWDKSEDALVFADNASIEIGTGLDMKLYHDGTDSYITNSTGTLKIGTESNNNISIGHSSATITVNGTFATSSFSLNGTTESTSTTSGALIVSGGVGIAKDVFIGNDLVLNSDDAQIQLGTDKEVLITHSPDSGIILSRSATGDNTPVSLTMKSNESEILNGESLSKFNFTSSITSALCASIEINAEGTFASNSYPTEFLFKSGTTSDTTSNKMKISSNGTVTITNGDIDGVELAPATDTVGASISLYESHSTGGGLHKTTIRANPSQTSDITLILPANAPTAADQVLTYNGSVLVWAEGSGSGGAITGSAVTTGNSDQTIDGIKTFTKSAKFNANIVPAALGNVSNIGTSTNGWGNLYFLAGQEGESYERSIVFSGVDNSAGSSIAHHAQNKNLTVLIDNATTSNAFDLSADALTTGSALNVTSSSAGKTTGALFNLAQTGATTTQEAPTMTVSTTATTNASAGVASFTGDALTTGKAVAISADALTTGSALDITSTSADKTTGGLVNIAQTGATTTQEAPTLTVSTSGTTHASAGVASFTGDALTTGKAVAISADALTTGSALDITSTSADKTTGGLVNIAQTGVTTTQEAPTLTVSTSGTTHASASVASFTGDALTIGKAVTVSADALTSGSALDITSTSENKTTGGLVNIAQTGVTTTQEAPTMTVSTTATTHASAGVASFTADALTTGKAITVSADALTSGSALDITSTSADKTTGALVNIAQTGVTTNQQSPTMTVSTTATTHSSAGAASFTADALTTGKAVAISADALTTGSALDITSTSSDTSNRNLVYIKNDDTSATGATALTIVNDAVATSQTVLIETTAATSASSVATPPTLELKNSNNDAAGPVMVLNNSAGVLSMLTNGKKALSADAGAARSTAFLRLIAPHQTAGSVKINVMIEDSDFSYTRAETYVVNFRYRYNGEEKVGFTAQQVSSIDNIESGNKYITDGTTSITSANGNTPADNSTSKFIDLTYNYTWNATSDSPKISYTVEFTGSTNVTIRHI